MDCRKLYELREDLKMNYLVTGAAGFIGSAIAKKLIMEGNTCTTIDNLFTGVKENIPGGGCRLLKETYQIPVLLII